MNVKETHVSEMEPSECSCRHCGLEFQPRNEDDAFCCSGCEYVYRLIRDEDFDKYYDLRGKQGLPVSSSVFLKRSWKWLEESLALVESVDSPRCEMKFSLGGISCVGCVWLIEKLFDEFSGGISCSIDVQRGTLSLAWKRGEFDIVRFADRLRKFGYEMGVFSGQGKSETREINWRIAVCGAFAMNAMLFTLPLYLGMEKTFKFAPHFNWLSAVCATGSMIFGGWHFIGKALVGVRKKMVHMDLPISIGLVVAYVVSWYGFFTDLDELVYFDFVSTFVFLMLVGRWVHVYAIERNRSRLSEVEIALPHVERILDDGETEGLVVQDLEVGDCYLVSPGDWVPVESSLCDLRACMGMDWINGESDARIFARGALLKSGGVNRGSESIEVRAQERWRDSLMNRLLESGQTDEVHNRAMGVWIARYLVAVMGIALFALAGWSWVGSFDFALRVFVSALVVSCPCALGVALPMADELAQSRLKHLGVFIKTNTIWTRLAQISRVVFDKTGTLTRSSLEWVNVEVLKGLSEEELVALSRLVSISEHPVASTVREYLFAKGVFSEDEGWVVAEVVGDGVEARKGDDVWRIGRSQWAGSGDELGTVFSKGNEVRACLEFRDTAWPDAAREVGLLKMVGKDIQILSGDVQSKVDSISESLGLDRGMALGGLLPQDKEAWILEKGAASSMMIGDGANDSLAFDAATVTGTPAADKSALTGKADFYYMGTGISGVRQLLETGKQRGKTLRMLVAFSVSYNVVVLSFAVCGAITPLLAAVVMPISSLVSLGIVWSLLGK